MALAIPAYPLISTELVIGPGWLLVIGPGLTSSSAAASSFAVVASVITIVHLTQ